ncbi:MAG: exodeoxyribonuclease VII small subunit [Bryobacteraceae bacterium]
MSETNSSAPSLAGFEASLEELERIVKELESGDLPLEKALALFEKGIELSTACRRQLLEAQTKVEILLKKRNGEIQPETFPDGKE